MKALVFEKFGGPEVLGWRDVEDPVPGPGEALVRTHVIGLNFADVYRRQGRYHLEGRPPWITGYEAAGVVEGGALPKGLRVAFADSPFANAEKVVVPVGKLIPLPDDVTAETAAALLLQGLTAQYLVRDSHPLRAGEAVVVHAAAGGVGQLLVQLCKAAGARVLGLTSSPDKTQAILDAGADAAALLGSDWPLKVRDFAGGGADVVYDSVGTTLLDSLRATRVGGHVVFYGMAGGEPPVIDPRLLMDGSKRLSGGDLWNVLHTREDRVSRAGELFDAVRAGKLKVKIAARFPLAEGAAAHAFLEGRSASGKVLLISPGF